MAANPAIDRQTPTLELFFSVLQIAYPLVVLFVYLTTFTISSIVTARNRNEEPAEDVTTLGPGGKPLPKHTKTTKDRQSEEDARFTNPQRLLFEWLTVGICFTLIGNIVVVIAHALIERKEGWWCGQAPTVCQVYVMHKTVC